MRKILSVLLSVVAVFVMCSCTLVSASAPGKYYAYMTQNDEMIVVHIYSEDDNEVFTFEPCRKSDFWGICWENDSYNLWVQSGDIGIICYTESDEVWSVDDSAVRPDYIISKYE